jgi:hypothetical protein
MEVVMLHKINSHRHLIWWLVFLGACGGTDVVDPGPIPVAPRDTVAIAPRDSVAIAAPADPGPNTITVQVLPYGNGCVPAWRFCEPASATTITLDGVAGRTFSSPGPIEFSGVAAGTHVLQNISGYYGGPVICGFWFDNSEQQITVVLEEGRAITVPLHFECF